MRHMRTTPLDVGKKRQKRKKLKKKGERKKAKKKEEKNLGSAGRIEFPPTPPRRI